MNITETATIKKIGEVWITPKTLQAHFPEDCVVDCDPIDMRLTESFPILLKKVGDVKYDVFGNDREDYEVALEKIRGNILQKEFKEYGNVEREKSKMLKM